MQAQVIFVLIELEHHCLDSWLQIYTANGEIHDSAILANSTCVVHFRISYYKKLVVFLGNHTIKVSYAI